MEIEKLIDKTVFIVLRDIESLEPAGINNENLIATIKGKEKRQGIWIKIDNVGKCPVKSGGKLVENTPALIFLPWYHIVTIVHFPEKDNLEIDFPRERKIGFRQE